MGDLFRDPELESLINQMNAGDEAEARSAPAAAPGLDAPGLLQVGPGEPLETLLAAMLRRGASDLVLVPGSPPVLRVAGRLVVLADDPLEPGRVEALFTGHLGARSRASLDEHGCADFSLRLHPGQVGDDSGAGWRLRVNLQRQRGHLAAGLRLLPRRVPSLAELNLPPGLLELVTGERGLVVVSGPTGSGKSTTLAMLVDHLNRAGSRHVITVEDPIEYEHRSLHSVVEQVEVGTDTSSFATALRAALRRDPDVILVGEMRDLETAATVLTAAETGHLILTTLHTGDAVRALTRMVDVFPGEQQEQVRRQLALGLHAVVCQQLVPTADGRGRVPAVEVLVANDAVRAHVRKRQEHQLYNEMLVGRGLGMVTMEESLAALVKAGAITHAEARRRANHPEELERRV